MYGYIYIIIFPKNSFGIDGEPFYIGQKKGEFDDHYWGSGTKVKDWYKKRGLNSRNCNPKLVENLNIQRKVLKYCDSQDELNEAEKEEINKFLGSSLCLNLCEGGNQPFASEELKKKISEKTKEAMWRDDVREKYLKSLETRFTEETYKKMSEAAYKNKNFIKLNESNVEKHKEITKDPKRREERRKKKAAKTGIKIYCVETDTIYDSISHAETLLKCGHIAEVVKGKRRHTKGLHFFKVN